MRNSFTFAFVFIMVLAGCVSQTVDAPVASETEPIQSVSTDSLTTPGASQPTGYLSETPLATLALHIAPSPTQPITPVDTVTPSATSESSTGSTLLPDLIILYSYLDIEGRTENCISGFGGFEVRVVVKNIGTATAAGFHIQLNGVSQFYEEQLLPDQLAVIHFSGVPSSGTAQIHVDASNQVQELNEDNNTGQYIAITPTLPAICTPTFTPVS